MTFLTSVFVIHDDWTQQLTSWFLVLVKEVLVELSSIFL